jgi:hypothetical protein
VADDRVELDFSEISATLHLPVLTSGGVDLKVGKYLDPMSADVVCMLIPALNARWEPLLAAWVSSAFLFHFSFLI